MKLHGQWFVAIFRYFSSACVSLNNFLYIKVLSLSIIFLSYFTDWRPNFFSACVTSVWVRTRCRSTKESRSCWVSYTATMWTSSYPWYSAWSTCVPTPRPTKRSDRWGGFPPYWPFSGWWPTLVAISSHSCHLICLYIYFITKLKGQFQLHIFI